MIPLFPLPNVVLFPNVFLPLHIFEERYREMVKDALAGDRLIGMVLLRQERPTAAPSPVPPVHAVGCTGVITHVAPLRDGRYNIVLRGVERFRILSEDHARSYRRAAVERLVDEPAAETEMQGARCRLEQLLEGRLAATGSTSRIPREMSSADLVNTLAQYLEFEPLERQALLERDRLIDRCRSMIDLLEMKSLIASGQFGHCGVQ